MLFRDLYKPPPAAVSIPSTSYQIRPAITRDNERIATINGTGPWAIRADILAQSLADPYCITRVAERGGTLAGFLQYRILDYSVNLVSLAVAADRRRQGVGRLLAEDARLALRRSGRARLVFVVPEVNLPALLFWRACAVRATGGPEGILKDRFGPGIDGILFEWPTVDGTNWALAAQNCPGGLNDVP